MYSKMASLRITYLPTVAAFTCINYELKLIDSIRINDVSRQRAFALVNTCVYALSSASWMRCRALSLLFIIIIYYDYYYTYMRSCAQGVDQ